MLTTNTKMLVQKSGKIKKFNVINKNTNYKNKIKQFINL
jgi:hypothetical protein